MTQAQQALAAIKAYMAGRTGEDARAHRRNLWIEVADTEAMGFREHLK